MVLRVEWVVCVVDGVESGVGGCAVDCVNAPVS